MASDNDITIVIAAEDRYSETFDKAARSAERSMERVKNSFENASPARAVSELNAYETALKRVGEAEAVRRAANGAVLRVDANAREAGLYAGAPGAPGAAAADDGRVFQARLAAFAEFNDSALAEFERARRMETAIDAEYTEAEITLARNKRDWQVQYASAAFGASREFMSNLYAATGRQHREMFETMKAFAVAETLISTYAAAQTAFERGMKETGSYWGGIAYAAAATVAGLARVAEIQRQHPGGGAGGGASGGANPGYGGGSPSAYPAPQRPPEAAPQAPQEVTVNVYNPLSDQNWQRIVEENIMPAINNAAQRNIVLTVRNM
ncbi:MAG: hypothetical protein HY894_07925 [Deltaproteobacteria bacterium]|nr:hypothetical protein [Deltaproteobacteria bacterium]